MTDEKRYLKGEEILYSEDNMVLRVKIIENKSTINQVAYRLEIVKNLVPHYIFGKLKVGGQFEFSKFRSSPGCGNLRQIIEDGN